MFLGVPYVPFFIGAGSVLLLAMYSTLYFLLLLPPVILAMRQMARRDEMIFRQLALRWRFRIKARNLDQHPGVWVFSPNSHRRRPPRC